MSLPLVLGAALVLGQADAGYVREQTGDGLHCLRWPVRAPARSPLTFVQSSAGDFKLGPGLFDAVSRAQRTWSAQSQLCGSLDLLEGPQSGSRATGYDRAGTNENLILVRTSDCFRAVGANDPCRTTDTCGNTYDCWDHGAAILALTLLTYDAAGALLDTDIEINGALSYLTLVDAPPCPPGQVSQSCVGNDVQNAVTHELGHALGLAHSPDPASTMYATGPLGETSKRVLDLASKQFICDVYPPGLGSRDCDGGTGGDPGAGGTGGGVSGGATGPTGPGIARTSTGCEASGQTGPTALLALAALLGQRSRTHRRAALDTTPPTR